MEMKIQSLIKNFYASQMERHIKVKTIDLKNMSTLIYIYILYLNNINSLHLLQELELVEGAYVICIHTVADMGRCTIIKGRTKSKK